MNTVFMNSENNKTVDPHRLLLNFSDKTNLQRSDQYRYIYTVSVSLFCLKN